METLEKLHHPAYYKYYSDGEYYRDQVSDYCDGEDRVVDEIAAMLGEQEIRLDLENLMDQVQENDSFYQSYDGDVQVLLHKDKTYDMCWHHEKLMGPGRETWDWYGREQGTYSIENDKITFTTVRVCNHNLFGMVADEISKQMKQEKAEVEKAQEAAAEKSTLKAERLQKEAESLKAKIAALQEKQRIALEEEAAMGPYGETETVTLEQEGADKVTSPRSQQKKERGESDEPGEAGANIDDGSSEYSDDDLPSLEGGEGGDEGRPADPEPKAAEEAEEQPKAPDSAPEQGDAPESALKKGGDEPSAPKEPQSDSYDPFGTSFWGDDKDDNSKVPAIKEDEEMKHAIATGVAVPCPKCGEMLPEIGDLISHLMEAHMDMAGFRASLPNPGRSLSTNWKNKKDDEKSTETDPQPSSSQKSSDRSDVQPSEGKLQEPAPSSKQNQQQQDSSAPGGGKLESIQEGSFGEDGKSNEDKAADDKESDSQASSSGAKPSDKNEPPSDDQIVQEQDGDRVALIPAPPPTRWIPVNRQVTGYIDPAARHVLALQTHTGNSGPDQYANKLIRCRKMFPEIDELKLRSDERGFLACCEDDSNPDRVEELEVLLDKGVDINCTDDNGNTALHLACKYGHSEIVDILTTSYPPADVNARNNDGDTPLMIAAENKQTLIVELLLKIEPSADPTLQNNDGKTALLIASEKHYGSTMRVLVEADGITPSDQWDSIIKESPSYLSDVYRDLQRELRYLEL